MVKVCWLSCSTIALTVVVVGPFHLFFVVIVFLPSSRIDSKLKRKGKTDWNFQTWESLQTSVKAFVPIPENSTFSLSKRATMTKCYGPESVTRFLARIVWWCWWAPLSLKRSNRVTSKR